MGWLASGRCFLPVICTAGAPLDCGVFLVPYQPDKPGVSPQADVLPGLLGDIATAGIEVTHENEILKDVIWNCHLVGIIAMLFLRPTNSGSTSHAQ